MSAITTQDELAAKLKDAIANASEDDCDVTISLAGQEKRDFIDDVRSLSEDFCESFQEEHDIRIIYSDIPHGSDKLYVEFEVDH